MPLSTLVAPPPPDAIRDFARDVARDLALTPKQIQSKYLYDALGSSLFESICRLPWYRITRAESRLLARSASEMVDPLEDPVTLLELGCGSGEKIATLAEALRGRRRRVAIHLIDISPTALELSERALGALEHVSVVGHRATYEEGLRHAARDRPRTGGLLVLFLGSNIGNFDSPASQEFLAEIRAALRPGDGLLLGADLVKPEKELMLAYDDPLGVTAAFNKNLLVRMNRELGANFDLTKFEHRAVWNPLDRRVEMHLVSMTAQLVRIPRANVSVDFAKGEYIWTESSYKYEAAGIIDLVTGAGYRSHSQWVDPDARFALTLFMAE
ncbi:MAG TPA: L-histidine N(alpha)-methyltransferase [Thermoanaerobaculia bacterium]|nr:L-histidine N(alpha)-methyltransferase [Thermoanaerobaculia bacterium]